MANPNKTKKQDDNRLYLDADLTKVKALGQGQFEGIVATSSVDRHGEILDVKGLDVNKYVSTNPIVLFGHDYWEAESVIGRSLNLTKTKTGELLSKFELFTAENPKAALVAKLIKKGVLALSIGFIPQEIEGDTYTKSEMVEYSVVPVPANAEAAITARSLKLNKKELSLMNVVFKGAISSNLPTADEGASWNAGAAIKAVKEYASDSDGNIDFTKYRKAFFWVDPENADKQGGYKLPFATVNDGKLEAVWNGVAAAMEALNGARGGVDIPDDDKGAVYTQIKKYYKKFDKDIPELKAIKDAAVTKGAVQDELDAEAMWEAKRANLDAVCDIWWAFIDVYCSQNSAVDDFNTLLKEVVGLFTQVLAGTYVDPDESTDDEEDGDEEYPVTYALKREIAGERMEELMQFVQKQIESTEVAEDKVVDNSTTNKGIADDGDVNAMANLAQTLIQYLDDGDEAHDNMRTVLQALAGGSDTAKEAEEEQSTGGNPDMEATNTVRDAKTTTKDADGGTEEGVVTETDPIEALKKLDKSNLNADTIKQLATDLRQMAVELEEDATKLASSTTDGANSPTARKRKFVMKQARKKVVRVDKLVELTLAQLPH